MLEAMNAPQVPSIFSVTVHRSGNCYLVAARDKQEAWQILHDWLRMFFFVDLPEGVMVVPVDVRSPVTVIQLTY